MGIDSVTLKQSLSFIDKEFDGDTTFPEIKDWYKSNSEEFNNDEFKQGEFENDAPIAN